MSWCNVLHNNLSCYNKTSHIHNVIDFNKNHMDYINNDMNSCPFAIYFMSFEFFAKETVIFCVLTP